MADFFVISCIFSLINGGHLVRYFGWTALYAYFQCEEYYLQYRCDLIPKNRENAIASVGGPRRNIAYSLFAFFEKQRERDCQYRRTQT